MSNDLSAESRPVHVLLVEDNPHDAAAFQRTIAKYLSEWQCEHCPTSEEAIGLLIDPSNTYDMVVADLMLPGMDGLELCQKVLALDLGIPLVILTGEGSEAIAVQALRLGVDDYIVKDHREGYLDFLPETLRKAVKHKAAQESLKESEERFRLAFEGGPIGNLLFDDAGVIRAFNPAAEAIFECTASEAIGQQISTFISEPDREDHDRHVHEFMKTAESSVIGIDREATGLRKNGEEFPIRLQLGKIDSRDRPSFIALITDLAEKENLERQLRQAQKMEAVGQLTGGVAHDFNNLLSVIYGNIELAMDSSDLAPEARETLVRAMAAAEKGAHLVEQLLIFSRHQALNPHKVAVKSLLMRTIDILTRTLGEDINIKTALESQVPLIDVDPGMLENAILNLALNARDAMPGGGTLSIETSCVDLEGEFLRDDQHPLSGPHVVISVSDTGMGMEEDAILRVFEPFYTTKGVGEGSGLGLSMVYGFVTQSGGHVTIDSARGEGTTVNLYFPAVAGLDGEGLDSPARMKADLGGTETILVVEDDEAVRNVTVAILSQVGYTVIEAEDGPSALTVLSATGTRIDLVFSDVIMPSDMSGYDLAQEVGRHHPDVKVLLTSGYQQDAIDKAGVGVTVLRKPYRKAQLAEAVREILD